MHNRDDDGAVGAARPGRPKAPRPHFDPGEGRLVASCADAKSQCRRNDAITLLGVVQRLHESRSVGDMDALEEAAADQNAGRRLKNLFGRRAGRKDIAVLIMAQDEIADGVGEHAVTVGADGLAFAAPFASGHDETDSIEGGRRDKRGGGRRR